MVSAIGAAHPGGGSLDAPQPRLVSAAHEFEAQMMKELLRPMTSGDEDGEDKGVGTMGEFASESLAGALSAHGGFGISTRIVHELSHSGNSSEKIPVTNDLQTNTGLSSRE